MPLPRPAEPPAILVLAATAVLAIVLLLGVPHAFAGAGAGPVVVIDPGHGGSNTGARSPYGNAVEKGLALALASRTAEQLRLLYPRGRVLLTREHDEYLTLDERVRRAEAAGGDLFVSLHLNASEARSEEGFETFFLSRDASDREAARLAALENSGGPPGAAAAGTARAAGRLSPEVGAILGDLARTAAHASSARLAANIQAALRRVRGARRDRGVRQAAFDVLLGLEMPAVLVEVGFIDHPVEGPLLVEPAALEPIALALAAGIAGYVEGVSPAPRPRPARPR